MKDGKGRLELKVLQPGGSGSGGGGKGSAGKGNGKESLKGKGGKMPTKMTRTRKVTLQVQKIINRM